MQRGRIFDTDSSNNLTFSGSKTQLLKVKGISYKRFKTKEVI